MTAFLYNHRTAQWDSIIASERIPVDSYRVPNLPGDEEQYFELPSSIANNPRILRTLSKYRLPLADKTSDIPQRGRKRALHSDRVEATPTIDCDGMRSKILAIMETGVKVSDFTRKIRVSNQAYYRFMGQSGPDKGAGSDVYREGLEYFAFGTPSCSRASTPAKKPRSATPPPSSSPAGMLIRSLSPDSLPSPPRFAASETPIPDISTMTLPGQRTDSVHIPYTADQVRSMIDAHLSGTADTQAAFLRTLMRQYHTEEKKIQSVQLQRFRGMRGKELGKSNPVFYAAGVFFEKVRRAREMEMEGDDRERDEKEGEREEQRDEKASESGEADMNGSMEQEVETERHAEKLGNGGL